MSTEKIKQQLLSEKTVFKYEYGNHTLDPWLTDQLAAFLADYVDDIRDIALFDGPVTYQKLTDVSDGVGGEAYTATENVHFFYNKNTLRQFPAVSTAYGYTKSDLLQIFISPDFWCYCICKFADDGTPYFVFGVTKKGELDHGFFGNILQDLAPIIPVIALAVNFFAPGLGTAIGEAVLGAGTAAAYPALATLIGNVALNTAFNGGDVGKAVTGAAASFVGGSVGGAVSGAVDSATIGTLASAATSAALSGGDIKAAVGAALLKTGAKGMDDFLNDGDVMFSDAGDVIDLTQSFAAGPDTDPLAGATADDINWFLDGEDPSLSVPDIPVYTDTPDVSITDGADGATVPNVINSLTSLALAALKVSGAWNQAGRPSIRTPGARTSAGATQTANRDGTVTTTNSSGYTTRRPAPVGVPYMTADGSLVTNNGDGTYTLIDSGGNASIRPYTLPSQGSGIGNLVEGFMAGDTGKYLLIGGVGLALVAALRKGR